MQGLQSEQVNSSRMEQCNFVQTLKQLFSVSLPGMRFCIPATVNDRVREDKITQIINKTCKNQLKGATMRCGSAHKKDTLDLSSFRW